MTTPLLRPRVRMLLLAVMLVLSACGASPAPYALVSIRGLVPRLEFHLTDQDNRPVSADDYRGRIVLLYFGYTQCPDACPTMLAELSQALRRLGPQASEARVLFVTVDPQRDTAAQLKRYVSFFGPQFVGLRGDDAALTALARRYRVAYHREPPDRNGNYVVDHSSAVFIFDRNGRARLLAREGDPLEAITGDLRRLASRT